jgi:putative spermidine/putrescine transport system permease protein
VAFRPAGGPAGVAVKRDRPGGAALAAALVVAIFLLLPLLAVVPISFTPARFLSMPRGSWSLVHYRELVENPDWGASVLLSLRIGVLSSLLATLLATSFALGIWMTRPRVAALLVGFVLLPMVVPPIVSAMTLYFLLTALSQLAPLLGYDTWPGVVLAHVVMIAPFAVLLILVALAGVDRRIDLAARGCGATATQRALRVILPNIRFGVLMAALLSFVLSWEEIGVTLFITSVNAITLPRLMWMGVHDNVDPAIAAVSVVLIAITTLALIGRMMLQRGDASR